MKKKILFVVNPISGGLNKAFIPSLVDQHLDHSIFEAEVVFSEYVGHARILAKEGLDAGFEIIAAVGGDGTINEVASEVSKTDKIMAIIPSGSGNGLARTLKIPLKHAKAIQKINHLNTTSIDAGVLNGDLFFNMAGMGFDAHISALFAKDKTRGFVGYVKSSISEIAKYQSQDYEILIDEQKFTENAFMLSIANSSQYGNNAHVSPTASLSDGLLDVCIIRPFPLIRFPEMAYRMFAKSADQSKYVKIIKAKEVFIKREKSGPVHLDGEPQEMGTELNIGIKHLSLKLIV